MIDHRQTTDILVSSFKYVQYSTVQYSIANQNHETTNDSCCWSFQIVKGLININNRFKK